MENVSEKRGFGFKQRADWTVGNQAGKKKGEAGKGGLPWGVKF